MTTDTIGSTTNSYGSAMNNNIWGSPIVATASGTLQSVGVYLSAASGNVRVAIYSGKNATPKFTGLLGQSAVIAAVAGWNDCPISGVNIVQGTTYYIVYQVSSATVGTYSGPGGVWNAGGKTWGAFIDPSESVAVSDTKSMYMRITYSGTPPPVQGGYTDPAIGSYQQDDGSTVTVTAHPNPGYVFAYWKLDGGAQISTNPINVTMSADHNLVAYFQVATQTFAVTVTSTPIQGITFTVVEVN